MGLARPMRPGSGRWAGLLERPSAHALLIALLGLVIYSNTFSAPFQWDDSSGFLLRNPMVKEIKYFFAPSAIKGTPEYAAVMRRPVSYFTFALNYGLGGTDPAGYHVVNIAVHIANALLVYLLALLTFETPFLAASALRGHRNNIALFSSLLFVSHPVQTEAVTYIFQRHASLMALFYMSSVAAYAKSRLTGEKAERRWLYAASLFSALLAMKTKENAVTLPAMVALYEFFFFTGERRARALRVAPFFVVALIVPASVLGGAAVAPPAEGYESLSRWSYLVTEFRVFLTYLRLFFFPVNQDVAHDFAVRTSLFDPAVLVSLSVLAFFIGLSLWLFRLSQRAGEPVFRLASFGALWFFISLSVESSVIPIPMLINEYRLYLPSAGAITSLTALAALCAARLGPRVGKALSKDLALSGALVVLAFCSATLARNSVWRSEAGLWEDAVKKSPRVALAHYNLGNALWRAGAREGAVEHFKEAVRLDPGYPDAHYNLGVAYFGRGLMEESIKHYEAALGLAPGDAKAHTNLANAYWRKGEKDKAVLHFKEAARLAPGDPAAYINLGSAYIDAGRREEAVGQFKRALELDPASAAAHYNLGSLYEEMGMPERAQEHLEVAARLNPALAGQGAGGAVLGGAGAIGKAAEEANRRGLESFKAGRMEEAIGHFNRAAELRPGYAEAYYNLGAAYQNMGALDRAIEQYLKGLAIRPDAPLAHNNLGLAYLGKRSIDDAVKHFKAAVRLKPDYAEAYYNLGNALMAKGDAAAAAEEYARTVRLRPEFAEAHNNLGLAYMAAGRLAEAKGAFQAALRHKPGSAGGHFNLGLLYMKEDDREKARREFEAALKIDPGMAAARQALEKLKG